ncbi:class I SAM-dependent methyltransferase [Knoellia flava]|uniref:Class I SAM-dependent methyltransferase n=2 Tax=Knoellia flava TaxID=913969 RepID=A0A8H9FQK8_9MICO|nr:methyltransferase domain-containing protein [Knoellia flava]GGB70093.1 hypothetical protein GCM10011314_06750 [Knoellia flava]
MRYPGKKSVEDRLHRWETATGRGDVPLSQTMWDEQYGRGRWSFLSGIEEMAHYAVIVGYATFLKPDSSVLDVGCGAGVLHERFSVVGYRRYTGVDISQVAVESLQDTAPPHASFHAFDAATFTPEGRYDVIVFNESITYFADPLAVFARYQQFLSPGGIVIVSCHVQSPRARAILRRLERENAVIDATDITQGRTSWRCVAFGDQAR